MAGFSPRLSLGHVASNCPMIPRIRQRRHLKGSTTKRNNREEELLGCFNTSNMINISCSACFIVVLFEHDMWFVLKFPYMQTTLRMPVLRGALHSGSKIKLASPAGVTYESWSVQCNGSGANLSFENHLLLFMCFFTPHQIISQQRTKILCWLTS